MGGSWYESYTWSFYCFNWYHWILSIGINLDILLYTHICFVLYICMLTLHIVSISIGIYFLTYIYRWFICADHIPISWAQILFMLELELQLCFNWFNFQLVSYFKPTHSFCWYFIKGEKSRFSYFNWYLYFHSLAVDYDFLHTKYSILVLRIGCASSQF